MTEGTLMANEEISNLSREKTQLPQPSGYHILDNSGHRGTIISIQSSKDKR